jgi:predicted RNA-binding Zn ribbon-like protein
VELRHFDTETWKPLGGSPALNYANTLEMYRGEPDVEWLHGYADVVTFVRLAALLGDDEAVRLGEKLRFTAQAEQDMLFEQARHLRHVIRQIFVAYAAGEKPGPLDIAELSTWLAQGGQLRRLGLKDGEAAWVWRDQGNLQAPLYRIAWAAADLLMSETVHLVRQCEADDCDLLFIDNTRNHSRRWCSMEDCGNRAKARRHYQRMKKKAARG